MVVDDQFDGKLDMNADIRSGLIGRPRTQKVNIMINPKNVNAYRLSVHQVGAVMCRNQVPKEIADRPDLSATEKWQGAVVGVGGGDMRRGKPCPPMMQPLHDGTANPIDHKGRYAYNKDAFEHEDGREIPFIMAIMWCVTTMGESVRNTNYGLCGANANEDLLKTVDRYVSVEPVDITASINNYIDVRGVPLVEYDIPPRGASRKAVKLSVWNSVSVGLVRTYLASTHGATVANRTLPPEFKVRSTFHCQACWRAFTGFRKQKSQYEDNIARRIEAHPDSSPYLTQPCPKHPNKRCIDMLTRSDVVLGATLLRAAEDE